MVAAFSRKVDVNLGEYARAIEDYDRALQLDPGHAKARNNRETALRHLGE